MPIEDLLRRLREFDALRDVSDGERADVVHKRVIAGHPPEYFSPKYLQEFPKPIQNALAELGITALYAHQVDAIELILNGEDVVLEAPTASGKTLCFNIPIIQRLLEEPRSHVLMIHPMKALSNDQRRQYEALASSVSKSTRRKLESWIYDGDLPEEHRRTLRYDPPAVLYTNPEMLHLSFLAHQAQWDRFLSNLKIVVLDEIHEYRGYFGTNVALLLRRFFAKLTQLGVRPQLVLATATCSNAEEHAYRLTGRHCKLIRTTTAARAERHFAFIDPAIPDFRFHDIYKLRIARAALACLAEGLSVLVFCPSRKFVEEVARCARRDAPNCNLDPANIVPYRSGYTADERRDIEEGLRAGRYKVVFTTNALEIGIDIGRLDACILAGFPDSVFSAWQRIGRVGRSWNRCAYILFYAFNNPFDRFFANNIDAFLEKPLDEILIGVDNEELMSKHLPYLIYECGGPANLSAVTEPLGETFANFAKKTVSGRQAVTNHRPNYSRLSIRGGTGVTYRLKLENHELGTISDVHLFREAYVGAIYNHFGKAYRVKAHGADEVLLEEAAPHLQTEGSFYTVIQSSEVLKGIRYDEALAAYYGKLTVFENFAGYKLIDTRTNEVLEDVQSQDARRYAVRGFWLEVQEGLDLSLWSQVPDLFGLEQILRIGAPFVIPCDRHDLGTYSGRSPLAVYLYETLPGGIGVAEKALDVWITILKEGFAIAEKCRCRHGCPSCVVPPRLPQGRNEPPKKEEAIQIARALLTHAEGCTVREVYDPDTHTWQRLH
jgi:DEAD/DEAH box helicase domain-containing protein